MVSNNEILYSLGIDSKNAKEKLKQHINDLKNSNLELNWNEQYLDKLKNVNIIEAMAKTKKVVSEKFPNIDPDKFIKFIITAPIASNNNLDFSTLIKLFDLMDGQLAYKIANSDLPSIITVTEKNEPIEIDKYFKIFKDIIFPMITGILIPFYLNAASTEQMNRIENQNEIIIQQNQELQYQLIDIENQNKIVIQQNEDIQYQLEVVENQIQTLEDTINQMMNEQSEYNEKQEKMIKILNELSNE